MTFLNFKHYNTFIALVGISPSGAIIFVSLVFILALFQTKNLVGKVEY